MSNVEINQKKVVVVMPAYNAAATLEKTINDIPLQFVDELILVDDASQDDTVALAREIIKSNTHFAEGDAKARRAEERTTFTVESLPSNRGYGGNQKKCYEIALDHGADIVVMLHPDYQYDPKLIKYFVEFIRDGYFDVMLGSRIRSRQEALAGGMPQYKYYANRILTFIQNLASGRSLSEWHTGMRAYSREVLIKIDYDNFSNDFIFDTQMLFAVVDHSYTIGDIPVPVRYFKEASSIQFGPSVRYGTLTLVETVKFVLRTNANFFKYIFSGLVSFVVNISCYFILLDYAGIHYIYAASISFLVGGCVAFMSHKFFTFKVRSLCHVKRELLVYWTLSLMNVIFNSLILFFLVHHFQANKFTANVFSNSVVAIWNFLALKHVAFRVSRISKK